MIDYTSLPWEARDYVEGIDDGILGLKFGLLADIGFGLPVARDVPARIEAAAAVRICLGATVEPMPPIFEQCPEPDFDRLMQAYAWSDFATLELDRQEAVLPEIRDWNRRGKGMSAADFTRASICLAHARRRVLKACAQFNYVLAPTVAAEPYAAELRLPPGGTQHNPFCFPFNLSEQPAPLVCCGFTESGLPVGLQIIGKRFDGAGVLRTGRAYLAALPRAPPSTKMTDNVLEVRVLRKAFGGIIANDAISLDVPKGSITGLIGPNGSGKTTLFNCITGQQRIHAGAVRFEGCELPGLSVPQIAHLPGGPRGRRHDICLQNMQVSVSHAGEGFEAMFGRFSVEVANKAFGLPDFAGLGAKADMPARELSYSERKLLEIAMGLKSEPKMLLLDEPTAGVNPFTYQSHRRSAAARQHLGRHHGTRHGAQHARVDGARPSHPLPRARQAARFRHPGRDPRRPARHQCLPGGAVTPRRRIKILHGLDLEFDAGLSLCLISLNGAGKSTVLNAIFGFADIRCGSIRVNARNVTKLSPNSKLRDAGIGYVLQDS